MTLSLRFFFTSLITLVVFSCSENKLDPLPTTITSISFDKNKVSSSQTFRKASVSPRIIITFSQPLDNTKENIDEVFLIRDSNHTTLPITRVLDKKNTTLTITTKNNLDYKTVYTLVVTGLLIDKNKKTLKKSTIVNFETQDAEFLRIKSILLDEKPIKELIAKPLNVSLRPVIVVSFFHSLDKKTLSNVILTPSIALSPTLSNNDTTLTLTPALNQTLKEDTTYNLTIPTTLKSTEGKTLTTSYNLTFHTSKFPSLEVNQIKVDSQTVDFSKPYLSNVDVRPKIIITFSEAIQESGLTHITLSKDGQTVNVVRKLSKNNTVILTRPNNAPIDTQSIYKLILSTALISPNNIGLLHQIIVTLNTADVAAPVIKHIEINGKVLENNLLETQTGLKPKIKLTFLEPVKGGDNLKVITFSKEINIILTTYDLNKDMTTLTITLLNNNSLDYDSTYLLKVPLSFEGANGKTFQNEWTLTLKSPHAPPRIKQITVDSKPITLSTWQASNVSLQPEILISFSKDIRINTGKIIIVDSKGLEIPTTFSLFGNDTIRVELNQGKFLTPNTTYKLIIPADLRSAEGVAYGIRTQVTLQT